MLCALRHHYIPLWGGATHAKACKRGHEAFIQIPFAMTRKENRGGEKWRASYAQDESSLFFKNSEVPGQKCAVGRRMRGKREFGLTFCREHASITERLG